MQLRARHIARNVVFNWLGTLANMAVGFFFAPFILHRLGDAAYGVWVLAISVVGYLEPVRPGHAKLGFEVRLEGAYHR